MGAACCNFGETIAYYREKGRSNNLITMQEKVKNYLGVALAVSALMVGFASWHFVGSYADSADPFSSRALSVAGEGKVVAVPDIAEFTFSVITQGGKDLEALKNQNTEKINSAIVFLQESGIDEQDIKTQYYAIQPRYQYYDCRASGICPPADIVGYEVNQGVLVKVRDFSKVGDLLSGVVERGANSVSQLSFAIDDPTMVQNEAREQAIQKAKDKAEAIAKASGIRLGRLIAVEEGYPSSPIYYTKAAEGFGMGGADSAAPSIQPGSQEVVVNVMLRYEIK